MRQNVFLIAVAAIAVGVLAQDFPMGNYCGRHGPWYSDANITSDSELTLTVTGPHSGYVPSPTCTNITFNMTSDGSMIMPEQEDPTSCIGYLTSGNGGTLSLTYNNETDTILLGVRVPSTDITMTACN